MITVRLNGSAINSGQEGLRTLGDLVEIVKAQIDPKTIITEMLFNGELVDEQAWRRPLTQMGVGTLDVTTGDKERYCSERLSLAPHYLRKITEEFVEARQVFQEGNSAKGNDLLKVAVEDLNAYVGWLAALLALEPQVSPQFIENVHQNIETITKVGERLVQHMLYQSWWAVGQTIESDLEPALLKFLKVFDS